MLRPKFSIAHERRRAADEPASFVVLGACMPDAFDSLAEARLFVVRENAKYCNGSLIPFQPTHAILWQPPQSPAVKRRIPVRMIAAVERPGDPVGLYKEGDWKACVVPEWTYEPAANSLLLDDVIMGATWKLMSYAESFANFAILAARDARDRARFLPW